VLDRQPFDAETIAGDRPAGLCLMDRFVLYPSGCAKKLESLGGLVESQRVLQ
jgi:hypothetical protein